MNLLGRIKERFFDRVGVLTKINILVFLAFFAFMTAIVLHIVSEYFSEIAQMEARAFTEIGKFADRAQGAVLRMELNLEDFAENGDETAAIAFRGEGQTALIALSELRDKDRAQPVLSLIDGLRAELESVPIAFDEIARMVKELGRSDVEGLRAALTDSVARVERELRGWPNIAPILAKLQEARRYEQSYMLNRNPTSLGHHRKAIKELSFSLYLGPFDATARLLLEDLVEQYGRQLEEFAEVGTKLSNDLAILRAQLATIEPRVEQLVVFSRFGIEQSNRRDRETREQVSLMLYTGSGIALVILLVSTFAVASSIRRPLREIGDTMKALANEERDRKIPDLKSNDELADMAQSIAAFVEAIDAREQALKASQRRFRDFARIAADCFWETDRDLDIHYVSNELFRRENLLIEDLPDLIERVGTQGRIARADQPSVDQDRYLSFSEIEYERDWHSEKRYFNISGRPLFDDAGTFVGYRGSIKDVTARKLAEHALNDAKNQAERAFRDLRAAQDSLVQAEKMASLGQLVAGVAHEINTPIGIGLTASSHLREITDEFSAILEEGRIRKADLTQFMTGVNDACRLLLSNLHRAAELIQSFKSVAVDQTSAERRRFNVRSYLEEIVHSMQPNLKKTQVSVEIDCPTDIMMDSYPGALAQVVTNFIMNSLVHAYEPNQTGLIKIAVERRSETDLNLVYIDDGKGIPEGQIEKIFEPFFTTRRGEGGSGLGLHVVYNAVTSILKGTLNVESEIGAGTTFRLTLPIELDAVLEQGKVA